MLDADESQHLHAAWLVGQGQVPYRDFWENHTPLLYYALAPLTRWLTDRPEIYAAGRTVMVLLTVGSLVLLYRLGRRLGTDVAILAVVLLAVQWRFVEYTTQVRPDVPALLCWLLTLLVLVRWRAAGKAIWLWIAGLALGVGATFTPKASYGIVGVAALIVGVGGAGRIGFRRTLGALGAVAAGTSAPLLGLVEWLWLVGGRPALTGFVADTVVGNLHFPDLTKQPPASDEGWIIYFLGLLGLVLVIRRHGRRTVLSSIHGPLLLTGAIISAILILPTTPAVYSYTWLPVLATASVYASISVLAVVKWAAEQRPRRMRLAAALLAVVVVGIPLIASGLNQRHQRYCAQVDRMALMLTYACPGEPVLDGTALAVFRPAAYRYQVLVRGLRSQIATGRIPAEGIFEELRRASAPVAYPDHRLHALGRPLEQFFATYYVPGPDGLLLAGARVSVTEDRPWGHTSVHMLASGRYHLTVPDGVTVTIDGARVDPGLVSLERGDHELAWDGPRGTLSLVIAPCQQRRASSETP
ncbi:MAG TPA: glycosyltransferase family 39 protein [Methylomirabilota bacterium]|nr:glycosyltransferase family 39 protein [Methylomirabilota bacterium]